MSQYINIIIASLIFNILFYFILNKQNKNINKQNIILLLFSIVISILCYICLFKSKIKSFSIISAIYGNLLSFLIINFKAIKKNTINKWILGLILSVFIAINIETFVFNFRHFESMTFSHNYLKYEVDENSNTIEIKNINKEINNMHINVISDNSYKIFNLKIQVTDDGNELYYALPERKIYPDIDKSLYLKLNLMEKAHNIKIEYENMNVKISSVEFNSITPFWFEWIRFLTISILLFILFLIRPKSELYKLKCIDKFRFKKIIIIAFTIINVLILFFVVNIKDEYVHSQTKNQYEKISESILDGKVYLNEKVSDKLRNMKNPYDTNLRKESHTKALWDHAFFKGKYYVYFGIVPVMLFYIPCHLLFGTYPPMYLLVFLCVSVTIIMFMLLLYNLIKKYFKKTSFVLYIMLCTLFTYGFGSIFFLRTPNIYYLPIACGIMFSISAIYFWMKSIGKNKINKKYLFFGSLCMALVAGCRPQLLINAFLSIPIFYDKIKEDGLKNNLKNIFIYIVPFIMVGIALMFYNYIRFGSFLDFGANYNLTTNDMTKRGFKIDRTFLGLFYLLFIPLKIGCNFPFLQEQFIETNYMGITISEPITGSILAACPLLIISFLIFFIKKYFKSKKIFNICLLLTIFSLIILVADIQMAGILQRYSLDCVWMLLLCTILIILNFNEKLKNNDLRRFLTNVLIVLIMFNLSYNFLNIFTSDFMYIGLIETRPYLFWKIYYMIHFWL